VFSFAPRVNDVTSQRARVGPGNRNHRRALLNELMIFLQNALIGFAGTREFPYEMMRSQIRTCGI
jgi:hypothetical protein